MEELLAIAFKFLFRLICFIPEMIWELSLHIFGETLLHKLHEEHPNLFIFLMILILLGVISAFVYFVQ